MIHLWFSCSVWEVWNKTLLFLNLYTNTFTNQLLIQLIMVAVRFYFLTFLNWFLLVFCFFFFLSAAVIELKKTVSDSLHKLANFDGKLITQFLLDFFCFLSPDIDSSMNKSKLNGLLFFKTWTEIFTLMFLLKWWTPTYRTTRRREMTSWPALIDSKVENTPELEIRFYDIVFFFFLNVQF